MTVKDIIKINEEQLKLGNFDELKLRSQMQSLVDDVVNDNFAVKSLHAPRLRSKVVILSNDIVNEK